MPPGERTFQHVTVQLLQIFAQGHPLQLELLDINLDICQYSPILFDITKLPFAGIAEINLLVDYAGSLMKFR